MKIGELAKRARVHVQTIRFYEREGLLPEPPRTAAGYRVYGLDDLERVNVIRVSQKIGFTLDDIRGVLDPHRLLASSGSGGAPKEQARVKMLDAARTRLAALERKLADLQTMKTSMEVLVSSLAANDMLVCPAAHRASPT